MRAAPSTARFTASAELISGRTAPARTPIPIAEVTISVRGATRLPSAINASITLDARTTASNGSPALTRFAASTPPTDSTLTARPDCDSNRAANAPSTCLVAIDETTWIDTLTEPALATFYFTV